MDEIERLKESLGEATNEEEREMINSSIEFHSILLEQIKKERR